METVGIRELKNRLTHYVGLTKRGAKVIVTERGTPVAVLRNLENLGENAGADEKLAFLASRGLVKLPGDKHTLEPFRPVKATGRPLSEIITEERR